MISVKNVDLSFGARKILSDVELSIKPGEFVFLVGPTGTGKSTLLRLLYMDLKPDSGSIQVENFLSSDITKSQIPLLRRKVGVVFQDFKLLDDRSVFDNVAFTLHVTGARKSNIKKRVLHILADVGLSHRRNALPKEISGGEKQRVAIARALINEPFVLLADEPTGNLDPEAAEEIMHLLETINTRGTAILMATHNYELLKRIKGKVYQLKNTKLTASDVNG